MINLGLMTGNSFEIISEIFDDINDNKWKAISYDD